MFLKRMFDFYFMCSHVLPPLYITLYVLRTYREGVAESLGDWSYRSCEPSYGFCGSNTDLLEDQPLLLTKESSLQLKGSKGGDTIAQSQGPACRLWFSPSGMWVSGIWLTTWGHQAWTQASLSTEPSHCLTLKFCLLPGGLVSVPSEVCPDSDWDLKHSPIQKVSRIYKKIS